MLTNPRQSLNLSEGLSILQCHITHPLHPYSMMMKHLEICNFKSESPDNKTCIREFSTRFLSYGEKANCISHMILRITQLFVILLKNMLLDMMDDLDATNPYLLKTSLVMWIDESLSKTGPQGFDKITHH